MKRSKKQEREHQVLLGLVDLFIQTGAPVGSNTLKEAGFPDLSSATIRNYFTRLEKEGFLAQPHASGGRFPTDKAFRLYAQEHLDERKVPADFTEQLQSLQVHETREVGSYLQGAADQLSEALGLPTFISSPRFDQDFVLDVKMTKIDASRCLCILITDFGLIQTEVLPLEGKLSSFGLHRIEAYFHWRLTGNGKPENLKGEEEQIAQKLYNEVMVRYLVTYSNCSCEHIYQTGFSRLLHYPEFNDAGALATALSLFENGNGLRLLLRDSLKHPPLKSYIGEELQSFSSTPTPCSVITAPYTLNGKQLGSIGILGPMRIPYKELFGKLCYGAELVGSTLTRSLYKFKISYRQPTSGNRYLDPKTTPILEENAPVLLENKSDSSI